MYRIQNIKPVNNANYMSLKNNKYTDIVEYTIKDESMEPEILIGQRVVVLTGSCYMFNEKDIYLIQSPYGEMIRRLKMVSQESVTLIPRNIRCNNETFMQEDIKIIGKVKIC